jgi:predicted HicB family RNase H-like nuclease
MGVLKIRLSDEKHERLRQRAEAEGVSMNRLIDEWKAIALVQHDA